MTQQAAQPRPRRVGVAGHEHERGRLAEQQATASPIERPHALACERSQRVEAPHDEPAEDVVAPGDDEVGGIRREQIGTHPHGGGPGGARRRHGDHGPTGTQAPRESVSGTVIETRGGGADAARGERAVTLFYAAERGTDNDRDAVGIGAEVAAREQIVGGEHQQRRRAAARQAAVSRRAQLLDLAPASDAQVVHLKALDPRDTVDAGAQRRPEGVEIEPKRRHDTGGQDGDGRHAGGLQRS
jgi:hypothetical protein